MNDEIKEINIPENVLVALGDLTNGSLNYYKTTETVKIRHNTILNYITNLQEENERLNNIMNGLEEFIGKEIELYTVELAEENKNKLSIVAPIRGVYKEIYNVLQKLKGNDKE